MRVRARVSRIVSGSLGFLASQSPRLAFCVSDALGTLRALFASQARFPPAGPRAFLRRSWTNHLRTQLLDGWNARGGGDRIRALVRPNDGIARLRPPMIIGTFHVGPTLGLGVLAQRLQGETLVLRGQVGMTDQDRAAAFHRALEQLRANGFVVMALDPHQSQRIGAPFFGATLQLARGAFAIARIARVPIVPIVARWEAEAIELVVGEALPVSDDEQALAAGAARWLEGYLDGNPGEWSYRIRELLRPPA